MWIFHFRKFIRTDWVSKTVDIAPGHRILINEFVSKVQNIKNILTTKRRKHVPSESSKKQKLLHPSSVSNVKSTVECESNTVDLLDIANKIQIRIAKWQRSQTQYQLTQLKEHEQFELRILRSVYHMYHVMQRTCQIFHSIAIFRSASNSSKDVIQSNILTYVAIAMSHYNLI